METNQTDSKEDKALKEKLDKTLKENPELVIAAKDSILHLKCGAVDVHKKVRAVRENS